MSSLAEFDLGYEYVNEADAQNYADWDRRWNASRRDIKRWAQLQILSLYTFCIPTERRP